MFWPLRSSKELPLGIAWENDLLRIVDMHRQGKEYHVRASSYSFPDGIKLKDSLINREESPLVELLQAIRKENRWAKRSVVTALPTEQVIVRHLQVQAGAEEEVEKEVFWEAKQLFNGNLADYSFDYMVLGRDLSQQEPPHLTVMLAAVHKETALLLYELFCKAGFHLKAIDVIPLALKRALLSGKTSNQGNGTTVLLDLGNNSTQLAIVSQGQLTFSRSLPFSLPPVPQETGEEPTQGLWIKTKELLREMRRSLDYFQARTRQKAGQLIISGAGSKWPGFTSVFQELELNVTCGVPGSGLALNQHPDPSFAVALGLALKGVRE